MVSGTAVVALGLAEVVLVAGEVRGDSAELLGGDASPGPKDFQTIGDGAERASALASDLRNGQFLEAIELEDQAMGALIV